MMFLAGKATDNFSKKKLKWELRKLASMKITKQWKRLSWKFWSFPY